MPRIKTCLYIAFCLLPMASAFLVADEDRRGGGGRSERREERRERGFERREQRSENRGQRLENREQRIENRSEDREQRSERREEFRQQMENRFKRDDMPHKDFFPYSDRRKAPQERIREERFEGKKAPHRLEQKDFKERRGMWRERGRHVRNRFYLERRRDHIFDDDFWVGFRRRHRHWHFDNRFSWGVNLTWPALTVWFPWGWSSPRYYYYGDGGSIYYGDGQESSYLTAVDPAEAASEARRIANASAPLSTDQSQWMPLGMFAIAKEGGDDATEYLTLAVNKQGFISGAYQNTATGESIEIRGSVDQQSQRAAWRFVTTDWPIMETGIYNLTREESSLLVHFSERQTESRLIVRIEDQ